MATAGDRYEERTGNIWSYAHRGDMTGLKAAVLRGVDVNLANTVGWTAAHAAAAGGQTKALRYLIKKMDADLSIADRGGNLPVHHAAKNGHVHALRTLQELGADVTKVRLSQAKGKAVRELVLESYRKAGVNESIDDEGDAVEAVGYARKQSKSTAFWGPRRTPISCAIKKKIIKDKRKTRKEKNKAQRESSRKEMDKGEADPPSDENECSEEPSYHESVQEIKRQRKKKRRGRQRSRSHVTTDKAEECEKSMDQTMTKSKKIHDYRPKEKEERGLIGYECFQNDDDDDNGNGTSSDDDGDGYGRQRGLPSSAFGFSALAITENDSDSE